MKIHPKLESLLVPVNELVLDPANARKHPESQVEALAGWLDVHGLNQPIVLDGKKVISGNCVLMSFRYLGWEQIPAVGYTGPNPREFAIVDNRSSELSTWDIPVLTKELAALENLNVSSLGFEPADLTNLGVDLAEVSENLTSGIRNVPSPLSPHEQERARELVCPRCGRRFGGEE